MKDTITAIYDLYSGRLTTLIESNYGLQYSLVLGVYQVQGKQILSTVLDQVVSVGSNGAFQQLDATACWDIVSTFKLLSPASTPISTSDIIP